jgi:hypothetical protein
MKNFLFFLLFLFYLIQLNTGMNIALYESSLPTISFNESADIHDESTIAELLATHISVGVNSFYGRNRLIDFENMKIIDLKPHGEDSKNYEITLQITTCEPSNKAPYGLERITLVNEQGNIKITNFIHISTSQQNKRLSTNN